MDTGLNGNAEENGQLTFDHVANDRSQELIEANFKFYKQINDNEEFADFFLDWLFNRYREREDGK